jgi:hypothetical protein
MGDVTMHEKNKNFFRYKLIILLLVLGLPITIGVKANASQLVSRGGINRGDVNEDWVNDIKDLAIIAQNFNRVSAAAGWNALYDLNGDNIIDLYDLIPVSKFIGTERGNTDSNNGNMGLVTRSGNWLYFCNYLDGGYLYKVDVNGRNLTRVTTDMAVSINVVGDWIYYNNFSDEGKTYRIRVDGTGRTRLNNDLSINMVVYNGWIYYSNYLDKAYMYKMKYDGTMRTRLNTVSSESINVEGDLIYFINATDGKMYRMKTDGTGSTRISSDAAYMMNVSEGYIYYSNADDGFRIYRIKTDGTGRIKLGNDDIDYLNVFNDWIYYANDSDMGSIYKIRTDGTQRTKLGASGAEYVNVVNDKIYFENGYDQQRLYEMKTDGTGCRPLEFYQIARIDNITDTVNQGTYYSLPTTVNAVMHDGSSRYFDVVWKPSTADTSKAGTYSFEGTVAGYDQKVLLTLKVIGITSVNDISITSRQGAHFVMPRQVEALMSDGSKAWLDVNWDKQLNTSTMGTFISIGTLSGYSIKVNLTLNIVTSENIPTGVVIDQQNGWTYYRNIMDGDKLYKIASDGTGKAKITDSKVGIVVVSNGWVYFTNDSDRGKLYRVRVDGTGQSKIHDDTTYSMMVNGSWIYYSNATDYSYNLYKINVDGTGRTRLIQEETYSINVDDNYIYYTRGSGNTSICRINKDGTGKIVLSSDDHPFAPIVSSGWIYYYTGYGHGIDISRIKIDGTGRQTLTTNSWCGYMKISGDWIYYCDIYGGDAKLRKMKLDGTGKTAIGNLRGGILSVFDGWIYYENHDERNAIYKVRIDGTENQGV